MLVYNNGRFYAGKSSFALPNGSRINTDLELVHKCGFGIYPPSGNSYYIDVEYCFANESAETALSQDLEALGLDTIPKPVKFEKATGWEATTHLSTESVYEVWFDVNQNSEEAVETRLEIIVSAKTSEDIAKIKDSEFVQQFLNSIEP